MRLAPGHCSPPLRAAGKHRSLPRSPRSMPLVVIVLAPVVLHESITRLQVCGRSLRLGGSSLSLRRNPRRARLPGPGLDETCNGKLS